MFTDTELPVALIAPLPDEYSVKPGDRVILHGVFNDYEADVYDVQPARGWTPTMIHLWVDDHDGVLTWVWCHADRVTIVLTAEAAGVGGEGDG